MIKTNITEKKLYKDFQPIASGLDLEIVDISEQEANGVLKIIFIVFSKVHTTGIDDCSKFHRACQPRLELLFKNRDIGVEVSTPGLQRIIKDQHEFSIFKGKRCKIYDSKLSDWITGKLSGVDADGSVLLASDDSSENDENGNNVVRIPPERIIKAKLEYVWEGSE